jgi:hypothetical protein
MNFYFFEKNKNKIAFERKREEKKKEQKGRNQLY